MKKKSKTASSQPTEAWLKEFRASLQPFVLKGDYRGGLKIAERAGKIYPHCIDVRFQCAKLLGDWADELPPARQAAAKRKAIAILTPITRALSGREPEFRFSVCINYYYQRKDYRGMYRYGVKLARRREKKGNYAQGVGGAFQALNEYSKESGRHRLWAKKAVLAWSKYDLKAEKYYFAHYCQALSLALAGENTSALTALKKAARLSGRDLSDWEFNDVLEIIEKPRKSSQ